MKKNLFFICLLTALVGVNSWHNNFKVLAKGPEMDVDADMDFDAMFKNFDFEKFSQELEESLATEKKYDKPTKMEATKSQPKTSSEKDKKAKTPIPSDPEVLFLTPPMEEASVAGKKATIPVKKARDNAKEIMNDFVNEIRKLELKVSSFSPEVQEIYETQYRDMIDQLVIAADMITSKKVYQVQLLETADTTNVKKQFAPQSKEGGEFSPQNAQTLRKNILSTRKQAHALNAKIKDESLLQQKELTEKEKLEKFTAPKKDLPQLERIKPIIKKRSGGGKHTQIKKAAQGKKQTPENFDLKQELEQLTKVAAQPKVLPSLPAGPIAKVQKTQVQKPKMTANEKEVIDFCETLKMQIYPDLTNIVKGKKFEDAIKAKIEQRKQEAKKAPGGHKDYGHGKTPASSPWSRPMPYERPYATGRHGRDVSPWGGSGSSGAGPEPSQTPQAKSPSTTTPTSTLNTGKKDKDDDKETITHGDYVDSKEMREFKRKAETLKNQAKTLTNELQSFVSKFAELKDKKDELAKAYATEAKHPHTMIVKFKDQLTEIKRRVDELGEQKKLFDNADEKGGLTAALNAYIPHLLEITAKIDEAKLTKGHAPLLEGVKEMIDEMSNFGASPKASIQIKAKALAEDPSITGAAFTTAFKALLKDQKEADVTKCQSLRSKVLELQNLQAIDDTLGGIEEKNKKTLETVVAEYTKALKPHLETAKEYAGERPEGWKASEKKSDFEKLGLPAPTAPTEEAKEFLKIKDKILAAKLDSLVLPVAETE